jgi:hypothetical protein
MELGVVKIPTYSKTQEPRPTSNVCRFPHVYTMFREGETHPQEHKREDAMVVASGDVGRDAHKISTPLNSEDMAGRYTST